MGQSHQEISILSDRSRPQSSICGQLSGVNSLKVKRVYYVNISLHDGSFVKGQPKVGNLKYLNIALR